MRRGGRPKSMDIEVLCAAPLEALAHSPSQMPLSCPVAPPSQRELHKDDGGGGGDGVARRARAARASKAKSCATSCGIFSAAFCAASFTRSSFMCHLRAGVCVCGGVALRAAAYLFSPERWRSPSPLPFTCKRCWSSGCMSASSRSRPRGAAFNLQHYQLRGTSSSCPAPSHAKPRTSNSNSN